MEIWSKIITGDKYSIQSRYRDFLKRNYGKISIIDTSVAQDFEGYGHEKQFILLVTYKILS